MTMFVRCTKCGTKNRSMIQMDKESFKTAIMKGNFQNCAKCGIPIVINNSTVFFEV
jgi:NAD-dependent SIR2 family protein deacetylase